jgi:hypothetical protein
MKFHCRWEKNDEREIHASKLFFFSRAFASFALLLVNIPMIPPLRIDLLLVISR